MSIENASREMSGKLGDLIRAAITFAVAKRQKKDFTAEKAGYERTLAEFEAKLAKFRAELI